MDTKTKAILVRFVVNVLLVFGLFLLISGIGAGNKCLIPIVAAVAVLNVFKEIHDKDKGDGFDVWDLLADVAGIVIGIVFSGFVIYLIG